MKLEIFFKLISYSTVLCGFLALWISGTFGIAGSGLFIIVLAVAWFLESSRWQLSERVGTALIVLALPAFYLGWKFQLFSFSTTETLLAGILARMILVLTGIKLLQRKSDRDWIFLYVMSFFEVLLAAGLSISALYLGTFLFYLFVMVSTIVTFEIRRTSREVGIRVSRHDNNRSRPNEIISSFRTRKLPLAAAGLIILIIVVATPIFFTLPRVGGAGLGSSQFGLKTSTGFSDTVKLGGIGAIQQNDEIVMRVRFEKERPTSNDIYLRGIALDRFDNRSWSRSKRAAYESHPSGDNDLILFESASGRDQLLVQTIFLEPIDTPVIFAIPRTVAIQGSFPMLFRDAYGAISYQRKDQRITYKVVSDPTEPAAAALRLDDRPYALDMVEYLRLPDEFDNRIANLAEQVAGGEQSRYDKAVKIETFLRNTYGYTLEQKAGGPQPVADFLFNVREGHCEYFASAMALMLRTQGIATRIVNGFHGGEYNDTADMNIVRQRNAHAWVEVYFPKKSAWVKFDPTPAAGGNTVGTAGVIATVSKYFEALESFWIEYFVAYDDQGQASLAKSLRRGFQDYQTTTTSYLNHAQALLAEWWAEVRGDSGTRASAIAVATAIGFVIGVLLIMGVIIWLARRLYRTRFWQRIFKRSRVSDGTLMIGFYERLQRVLALKGFSRQPHQTPLEFAYAVGIPESVRITQRYNEVRFGEVDLSQTEADEIDQWLEKIEAAES